MKSSLKMIVLAICLGLALGLSFVEGAMRVYFAGKVGPRVLFYGTRWYRMNDVGGPTKAKELSHVNLKTSNGAGWATESDEIHDNKQEGYTKYFPNEKKYTIDPDTGERIDVKINAEGFRGPDFSRNKAPGTIRILTMGASSTFGYYDPDDLTYPHLLQQELNGRCGSHFEVINFAIPHATSANIRAMFLAEGLDLKPDAITFYEGRNDSSLKPPPVAPTRVQKVSDDLYKRLTTRLLAAEYIDQVLVDKRHRITDPAWNLETHSADLSRGFLGNLTTILDASRKNGIYLIVASQQASSGATGPHDREARLKLRGVTYAEEAKQIRDRWERGDRITELEYAFLVHQQLMKDMQNWAGAQQVPFVDVIGALDQRRDLLLSWVHLHPDANRIIAKRFADVISAKFCGN